ncbi:LPXTG cell wall anchor domain-containing protein [bacterium]|nr:LPXTG cell wall anchor domain-containing protein [bacterium]
MALNNFDEDQFDQESFGGGDYEPEPPKRRGNRTFLIAIAIVGIIFVIALILLLLVAPKLLANQRLAQQEQAAQINAANTATAMYATSMAQLAQATKTPTKTVVAAGGVAPTKTPVVVIQQNTPMGAGGSGLSASELATVSALQTQMAGRGVGTPGATSTALPSTGFADEVGLPMMAGLAIILVAVIVLSRRLRMNTR